MNLLAELFVDAALEAVKALEVFFVGLQDAVVEDFEFGTAEFAELLLAIVIPLDEGRF